MGTLRVTYLPKHTQNKSDILCVLQLRMTRRYIHQSAAKERSDYKMNKVKRAFRVFSSRNLMRKFPREASPLLKKLTLEPGAVTAEDILSFTKQFDFDDVWIFHGIALKQNGKAIILSGPSGIGKSGLLRKITRMGMAEPMDDGFILVGRADCSYYVLESGLYLTVRTISVLSKWLRMLFRYQCPYLNIGHKRAMIKETTRGEVLHNIAVLIGSIITKNRSSEGAVSGPVKLVKLLLVEHPDDCHPPRRICMETITSLNAENVAKIFENYARSEVIHSHEQGLRRILCDKILTELRR